MKVVRSPAKLYWHVMFNEVVLAVCKTRREAEAQRSELALKVEGLI